VSPRHARAVRWLLLVGLTAAASALLSLTGLPSPVLFGALAAGVVVALADPAPVDVPAPLFMVGQALVGAVIGAMVQLPTLVRLGRDWPSVLAVTVGTLLLSVAAGRLMALHRDVSPATGAFSLVAGGASGIVALARDLGADERVVTVVQYLRVLLVLVAMPVVTTLAFRPPTGQGQLAQTATRWGPDLVFVLLAVGLGLLVARRLVRTPASTLLAPMLVAVVLSASGLLGTVTVPSPLASLAYALIGLRVGLRFTRASLRVIARLLPLTVALILLVVAGCAGMGLLLSAVTGVDRLTAYLATTPGGLFAVLATAADSGSDVTYVLAVQVIRVFAMLLAAPLLARTLARRRTPDAVPGD
jgi:membrane AbrB-like protein